jgi:ABC-type branched-subunit amino acid transport system ATPase component
MPIVNAESTFGNFKWFAKCEVSEAVRDILANLGFLWVMQRSPSSNAEKSLAGYEKRPTGFKRSEIAFSDENAVQLGKLLGASVEIAEDVSITPEILRVVFHEIGAGVEPKYADEKKAILRHIEAKDIVSWASDKVGFTGEGDLDTENVEFLKAVKAFKARVLAEQM